MPKGMNSPMAKPEPKDEETRELYRQTSTNCLKFWEMGRVSVKNDEELQDRIGQFYTICAETGQTPTVEKMCLALGYDTTTVFGWQSGKRKGFTPETANIIKKAKQFLSAFDADLLLKNKLNPVAYIFRAKNYYDMSDKQEVVVTPNNSLGDTVNEEELAQKLISATEVIDVGE
ncbi:MAG: hypothetical protein Q4E74_09635 [Ruminococcus sp.]|nr:hypothetical protein [Ruminococcus sp.]